MTDMQFRLVQSNELEERVNLVRDIQKLEKEIKEQKENIGSKRSLIDEKSKRLTKMRAEL